MPDVHGRHRDVLGEAPITIDANDPRKRTYMRISRATQQAAAIHDVSFGGHAIALSHVRYKLTHLHHVTGELVPHDDRRLHASTRPIIPLVDMDVGAAYPRPPHANQHFVVAYRGNRHVLEH